MKSPAFSFYVRDWLSSPSILQMTGEETKAYLYLLCYSWLEDDRATLPNDDRVLCAFARVDLETWQRIKPAVMARFESDGNGRIFSDRLMAEHLKQHHRSLAATNREHKQSTNRAQKVQS